MLIDSELDCIVLAIDKLCKKRSKRDEKVRSGPNSDCKTEKSRLIRDYSVNWERMANDCRNFLHMNAELFDELLALVASPIEGKDIFNADAIPASQCFSIS